MLILLQSAAVLGGVVMGSGGVPIAGAMVAAGDQHVLTDAKGCFSLKEQGPTTLRISAKGFSPQEREAKPGETLLVLLEREAPGATVEVVEGSGYFSEGPSSSISRLEIYMTPGAAADAFQATKALPGVSNTSEGAELFVRGGKPEEVGIYLNGGRLPRPYHHPNTQGGIFSSVDTAMVTRLDFIPGGFSAKYGDALSARLAEVVAMKTAEEWVRVLEAADVPVDLCLTPAEAASLPQIVARQDVAQIAGEKFALFPVHANGKRGGSLRRPVPKAGEHTREILVEIGMDDAEIAEVLKSGAVRAG